MLVCAGPLVSASTCNAHVYFYGILVFSFIFLFFFSAMVE